MLSRCNQFVGALPSGEEAEAERQRAGLPVNDTVSHSVLGNGQGACSPLVDVLSDDTDSFEGPPGRSV